MARVGHRDDGAVEPFARPWADTVFGFLANQEPGTAAGSQDVRHFRIAAVAVANLNDAASPPCGACRQMLAEFVLHDAPVAFPAADGTRVMPFADVLPLAFDMKLK